MCGISLSISAHKTVLKSSSGRTCNTDKSDERNVVSDNNLIRRGPDAHGTYIFDINVPSLDSFTSETYRVTLRVEMFATTLHMRGDIVNVQPIVDLYGNLLMWNGEIFGSDSLNISHHQNDAQVLSNTLGKLTKGIQEIDVVKNIIQETLEDIEGPWAFSYWHAETCSLHVGRDKWGRRSLLYKPPLNKTIQTDHSNGHSLMIQSVATLPTTWSKRLRQHETNSEPGPISTQRQNEDEIAMQQLGAYQELPVGGFFTWDFKHAICSDTPLDDETENNLEEQMANKNFTGAHIPVVSISPCDSKVTHDDVTHVTLPMAFRNWNIHERSVDEGMDMNQHMESSLEPMSNTGSSIAEHQAYLIHEEALAEYTNKLESILSEAVRRRVQIVPAKADECTQDITTTKARVAVMFSGGLDSMVLAALAHRHVPIDQPIDLLNVCFDAPLHRSPDRVAAEKGFTCLRNLYNDRKWRFVAINAGSDTLLALPFQYRLLTLLAPRNTRMDVSIGAALWLAARGEGFNGLEPTETSEVNENRTIVRSSAKVLLLGIGADEQFGGYGRHYTAYRRGGFEELRAELDKDITRLWKRNLGRDDRICSDHGREVRSPYLDEQIGVFLQQIPLAAIVDPRLERGTGDKMLLRRLAHKLGLKEAATLVKRAIQFGSRVAKSSNCLAMTGSHRKASGKDVYSILYEPANKRSHDDENK